MSTIVVAPLYSIIFVCDASTPAVEVPEYDPDQLVSANETCISIGTLSSDDGATEVSLIEQATPFDFSGLRETFKGSLSVPSGRVEVITAERKCLLSQEMPSKEVEVSIWANDNREPDKIAIAVR
jgi:hypothetical protein